MSVISFQTASALTGRSERTLWRRIADGGLRRGPDDVRGRATLVLEDIAPLLLVPVDGDDLALLTRADAGDPEAQSDMGLVFLEADRPSAALYLFDLAAKQHHPEAMHWLGRCFIEGRGAAHDQTLGLSWLTRSAAAGHIISKQMIERLVSGALRTAELSKTPGG